MSKPGPSSTAPLPIEDGYGHPPIQELHGHRDVSTTMIYTHVLNRGARGVGRPFLLTEDVR